jgi:hypothetical protein
MLQVQGQRWRRLAFGLLVSSLVFAFPAAGEELVTFDVGSSSYLEIELTGSFAIPRGTAVVMRFADLDASGGFPVLVQPDDLAVAPVRLGGRRGSFEVALAEPARGVARRAADGKVVLEIPVVLSVTHDGGTRQYPLLFTTESASVLDASGTPRVASRGARLDPETGEFALVAAAMSGEELFDGPEQAVLIRVTGAASPVPAF